MKSAFFSLGLAALLMGTPMTAVAAAKQTAVKPSDHTLENRIEQRMKADATLKKFNIDVDVDHGVAKLTGTVATDGERARAAQHATMRGISRVDNQIVVDASAGAKATTGTLSDKAKDTADKAVDKTKEAADKT